MVRAAEEASQILQSDVFQVDVLGLAVLRLPALQISPAKVVDVPSFRTLEVHVQVQREIVIFAQWRPISDVGPGD